MHHSNPSDHDRHDVALIASHAARDLPDRDLAAAEALLSTCTTCAELHADLVAITAATRVVPAPAARLRDFRLSPEQAARLQRRSWLRAVLRPFAATRSTLRPMAAAFSSLGVAGLLVATLLPGMLGATASGPVGRDAQIPEASGAPALAPGPGDAAASTPPEFQAGGQSAAAPDDNGGEGTTNAQNATAAPVAVGGGDGDKGSVHDLGVEESEALRLRAADAAQPSLLVIASLAFLAVGLSLFGLRFAARRVR